MNNKLAFFKNMSFAFAANFLSLFLSTFLVFILPRFIGVTNYGYFQLYMFYSIYIAYMSLGITDGIYLRLGGENYNSIDKSVLSSQYWFLVIFNLVINTLICTSFYLYSSDIDKKGIVVATCIVGLLVVPRSLITFVLQATNRIREFSIIIIMEKLIYFIIVVIILFMKDVNYQYIIIADILGKFLSVLFSVWVCRDIVFHSFCSFKKFTFELKTNFLVGISLFISNLSSMLIIGIVRFFIEKRWDIETFGKVSLSLSISNMVIVFLNAIAVVLFPSLRKLDFKLQKTYYEVIRNILMPFLLFILVLYYPLRIVLEMLLPLYSESFEMMILLFPIIVFEGKTVVLVNTYLKTIRKEKVMLRVNMAIVSVSFLFSLLISYYLHNLKLMVLLILILIIIRNAFLEKVVSNFYSLKIKKDIILEILLTIIFIASYLYFTNTISFIVYLISYILYIVIKRRDIKNAVFILKK